MHILLHWIVQCVLQPWPKYLYWHYCNWHAIFIYIFSFDAFANLILSLNASMAILNESYVSGKTKNNEKLWMPEKFHWWFSTFHWFAAETNTCLTLMTLPFQVDRNIGSMDKFYIYICVIILETVRSKNSKQFDWRKYQQIRMSNRKYPMTFGTNT